MIQNYIIIFGIVELLIFIFVLYLIIRANTAVNMLQEEVNELHLCLPAVIRDIRSDLSSLNKEISEYAYDEPVSSQQIGSIIGKIFTEIILFRLNSLKLNKKFFILSIILKTVNTKKIVKHLFSEIETLKKE